MESPINIENGFTALTSYKSEQIVFNKTKKVERSYNILPIDINNIPSAITFLKKFFFRDEPLNIAIQLLDETGSALELEKYCISCLQYGMTFVALSQTGDIMGIILNTVMKRGEVEENNDEDDPDTKNLRFNNIVVLLDRIKREADVFAQYPSIDRIMEIKIVAVNDAYRGQGICKALIDKTKEFASEIGCQMIYVECTSHFSAKAVENLGFKCIYSLNYTDHVNEKGEIVFKTPTPHKGAKVYVLPLSSNNYNV